MNSAECQFLFHQIVCKACNSTQSANSHTELIGPIRSISITVPQGPKPCLGQKLILTYWYQDKMETIW